MDDPVSGEGPAHRDGERTRPSGEPESVPSGRRPSAASGAGPQPVPQLAEIAAYVMGKPSRRDVERGAKLSSNENPFGPSPLGIAAAVAALSGVNRYPEDPGRLREKIAALHGISAGNVITGAGSDEVIQLVTSVYLEPGRRMIVASPPYGIHRVAGQLSGAELVRIPLVDFIHDLPAMAAAARPGDVIAVTNPHNPTGTAVRPGALRDLLATVPHDCLVLVDEAYHEYMDDDVRVSAIALLDMHPGLVVSRTFSKAYGLAGLRVGYGVGQPEVLEPMERVRLPANVNAVGMAAATAALDDRAHVGRSVMLTRAGRDRLADACRRLGLEHVPSQANFMLVRDRDGWPDALAADGIVIRPGSNLGLPGWHRVTIGTEAQMDRVIEVLERLFA